MTKPCENQSNVIPKQYTVTILNLLLVFYSIRSQKSKLGELTYLPISFLVEVISTSQFPGKLKRLKLYVI